jgi:exodeoxyribonuclease V gamma subunit
MLRIVYSRATEDLLRELVEAAEAIRRASGPFTAIDIAVPNAASQAYVKFGFARFTGIAAHLRFHRLPSLLEELTPLGLDRVARRNLLLSGLLDEQLLQVAELEPVRRYIQAGGNRPEVQTLRRMQLFRQVDRLFESYMLYRPDVLQRWERGPALADTDHEDAERWQRALWLETVGRRWSKSEVALHAGRDETLTDAPVHVFGFTHLAPATVDRLGQLGQDTDVSVYLRTTDEETIGPLWSQPARDTARRLEEQPRVDLVQLGQEDTRLPPIELLACPSVRRELEVIASQLWKLLEEDSAEPALRFNDIAVVFPSGQEDNYQPLIGAVFGEAHDIPVTFVTRPAGQESRLLEVIELLIGLPLGRLTREAVLRFAAHPEVSPGNAEKLARWLDSAGVASALEKNETLETYLGYEPDWSPGLQRLALGAFALAEGDEGATEGLKLDSEDFDRVKQFSQTLRSLLTDIDGVRASRRALPSWMGYLATLITTHIEADTEEDERLLRLTLHSLNTVADMPLREAAVPYRVAQELVAEELSTLGRSLGNPLVGGVNVAPLDALQGVPFRVLFVAGLNAGWFPAAPRKNPLDLRDAEVRPGDLGPRERDRSLFLDTLLSAQDKVYLSYVSRDALTGEKLDPSSVYLEVRDRLRLTERDFPVRRYEDNTAYRVFSHSRREAISRELGRELRYLAGDTGDGLDLPDLRQRLPPAAWTTLENTVGLLNVPGASASANGRVEMPLIALRRFLECPLQGSTRYLLGMYDEEDTSEPDEEDVFHTSPMDRARILRDAFGRALSSEGRGITEQAVVNSLDESLQIERCWGRFPSGVFGGIELKAFLDVLRQWCAAFQRLGPNADSVTYCFGPAPEHFVGTLQTAEPLALEQAEITGTTQNVLLRPRGSLILAIREKSSKKELLKSFLDHVLLSASGLLPEAPHSCFVLPPSADAQPQIFEFAAISSEHARHYLTDVIQDLRSGVHEYLLPFETALELAPDANGGFERRRVRSTLRFLPENLRGTSSLYGPVRHPERFLAPEEDIALSILQRRFGLFYSSFQQDEAP